MGFYLNSPSVGSSTGTAIFLIHFLLKGHGMRRPGTFSRINGAGKKPGVRAGVT
jgi:hypothetical protein